MLSTQPVACTGPAQTITAPPGLVADATWPRSSVPLQTPPISVPCAPPANPPPEIAGSEPRAPPGWDSNAGPGSEEPPRPPSGLLTDEEKQRQAVVEKAKAQGIPLKVRLPDAALSVVRPLVPGCPAKKRLPWPDVMEEIYESQTVAMESYKRSSAYYSTPPEAEVPGSLLGGAPLADQHEGISARLLAALEAFEGEDEDIVWACVEDHIEPLSVLRATVTAWKNKHAASPWHGETAKNVLLLLDPSVTADNFPRAKSPRQPCGTIPLLGVFHGDFALPPLAQLRLNS
ncbi:unnamed protein product [Symbiodinium necroappetens]|uniref:Uncharacterized protein n=1 Tax=Symbiodinium necroappetens TaxID=1628268 RepID=A0A812SCN6_9DINO|nr:unnamed protein product [Symbiodinium necroappetens]